MCVCGIIQLSPTGLCGNWTPLAFDATSDNKSEPKGACAACLACHCAGIARAQSLAVFSTAHLSGPGTAALQPPPLPPVVVMQAPRYRTLCPPASASQRDTVNAKACMRVRCSRFSSYSNCCAVRHNATCVESPSTRRDIISGRVQTPSRARVSLKERCGGCCGSRPAALNVRTSAHIFVSIMHRCVGHAKKKCCAFEMGARVWFDLITVLLLVEIRLKQGHKFDAPCEGYLWVCVCVWHRPAEVQNDTYMLIWSIVILGGWIRKKKYTHLSQYYCLFGVFLCCRSQPITKCYLYYLLFVLYVLYNKY